MVDFSERLAQLRKERGLTQKQLAELTHLSERSIQNYEGMVRRPPIDIAIGLSIFFNVTTDYFLGLTDTPSPSLYRPESRE